MLSAPRTNKFPAPLALVLCLLFCPQAAEAQTASATPAVQEEVIEFEVDDPEVVGHLREEKTSYADYEVQAAVLEANENGNAAASPAPEPAAEEKISSPAPLPPFRGAQPTAMRLFRYLPPSIFDNTIEGMREDEKQALMDTGETEFWVLTALTEDELVIENKAPEIDTQATLILFHADDGDIVMAMGVTAGDSCALELWEFRAKKGGIAPLPMPDEPDVSEFFQTHRTLPQDTDVSMLLCLDPVEKNLVARPLIWTPSGLDKIVLDTRVIYSWNGKKFVKEVIPLH